MRPGVPEQVFVRKRRLPRPRLAHHAQPVQSSLLPEHDDKTGHAGYIRAMPSQEPAPHDVLHLIDDEVHGFASKLPAGKLGRRHEVELP